MSCPENSITKNEKFRTGLISYDIKNFFTIEYS